MFLLVQLFGIFLLHAPRAMARSAPGCTGNPNQNSLSCPPDPRNEPCYHPPCPNS
ncbi:hypothetical protein PVAP13_8KG317608 [Panicum virgatum]|uniref:Uncharacterized protein n=1 Tax=Panicum virgatum TaxID=38727 RepID=A0A8T0PP13_PANVG|nr:hypothetical protein PVAP13_8KG317608 [Panicum virgatum]